MATRRWKELPSKYKKNKTPNKIPDPLESEVQKAVIEWAECIPYKKRKLADYLHHSANGGERNLLEAKKFKAMGVKAGYPDLTLDIARQGYHGLRIELKRSEKEDPSDKQKERLDMLTEEGYFAIVCKGVDQTILVISNYMGFGKKSMKISNN